jgi:UDP-glucuronate 4-epimerase
MESTIYISGTAGFIGFHLARKLLGAGHRVIGYDNLNDYYPLTIKRSRLDQLAEFGRRFVQIEGDLCDLEKLEKVFADFNPSHVCNLAAQAGVRYSIVNPFAYQKSNLEGFLNLLECCRHNQVRRFVYASSSSVYGGNKKLPFSESDPVDTPISLYGATKKANELIAHSYSYLYDLQTIGLRFFTVYGPWGRPDMAMWIFAEKILNNKPIPVFNNGEMKRDFTYIDDIISGLSNALFIEPLDKCEVFNLGNHSCENLMDMISLIESALGSKAELDYLPMQPGDVPATYADIVRSQTKLNFAPETPIAEGIPKFCQWYLDHPDIADEAAKWRKRAL